MKRIIQYALLIALLGLAMNGGAASASAAPQTAVLTFYSFDGGGPEYQIEIDDPEIVTWTSRREYDDPDHDNMTGAGYQVIFTFEGLKPGETALTVSARSPLMEGFDASFAVLVDDALNVTLSQTRAISRFELYRHGEIKYDSYDIAMLQDVYQLSVNGGRWTPIDDETVEALFRVVERYDLFQWDGFDQSRENVLDGQGFRLDIAFTDGSAIHAIGDNAFPDHYFDAIGDMLAILEDAAPAPTVTIDDWLGFFSGLLSGNRALSVGTDVAFEDITDFYYTYASSTFPPDYQRYRFYVQDGQHWFFHETREGETFPLTEEDATVTGTLALSDADWARFCGYVAGGTVKDREESIEDGDAGPWMYLYWEGDRGECQEYTFASWDARTGFEAFCETLRDA